VEREQDEQGTPDDCFHDRPPCSRQPAAGSGQLAGGSWRQDGTVVL
jgi:hypothetical protein